MRDSVCDVQRSRVEEEFVMEEYAGTPGPNEPAVVNGDRQAALSAEPASDLAAAEAWLPRRLSSRNLGIAVAGFCGCIGVGIVVAALILRDAGRAGATETAASTVTDRQEHATRREPDAPDMGSQNAEAESIRRKSAAMTTASRDVWIRDCFRILSCKQWQVDAIVGGAPLTERIHADRVSFAASCESIAKTGIDGTELSPIPIGLLSGIVGRSTAGLSLLKEMPKTSIVDAKKDPDMARGSVVRVSGSVVEIAKSGDLYEGTIATGNGSFVRFFTPLSTDGIYDGSWATFSGIFVQQYAYLNVSGGQTRSILLVGAFEIPSNRGRW